MSKPTWTRTGDELTTKTETGTVSISRNRHVEGLGVCPWSLYINEHFHGAFDTEEEAILHAEGILTHPSVSLEVEDISPGEL